MKNLTNLLLACVLVSGGHYLHSGVATASVENSAADIFAKWPRYDAAYIEDREVEKAGLKGALEGAKLTGASASEIGAIQKQIARLERRLDYAKSHLGEPYIRLEEP